MKKLFFTTLFLAFVILLTAQTYTVGNLNYSINGAGATLTGHVDGVSAYGQIVIPESITISGISYPVTAVADSAFYGCSGLNGALVIPNTVHTIGNWSFYDCFFSSLTLSNTLTSIGDGAFCACTEIHGPLTIPESVEHIGAQAFRNGNFTGELLIPNSVTSIGDYAFCYCGDFTGLTLSNSLTSIGEGVFSYCYGFTGPLLLPSSLTSIGNGAFLLCTEFTGDLIIPESVTTIGDGAFNQCSGFTGDLIISESVTTIGESAFQGCYNITKVVFPSTLTYIGNDAFADLFSLNKVITLATTPPTLGSSVFIGHNATALTVPSGCIPIYQSSDWHLYFDTFNNDWSGTHADSYAGGDGSEANPYQIATAEQLALLAYETNNEIGGDAHYILTNDICLGGGDFWEPIGKLIAMDDDYPCFTGVFNGNGHTISDMLVSECYYSGLFGRVRGATIENVNIYNSSVVDGYMSGLVAGYIQNTNISNCTVVQSSIMESPQMAGGIVGYCRNESGETSNIINCIHNSATIFGDTYTGGIVGASEGNGTLRIEGCTNYGEIIGHIMAGGILGNGKADIDNCTNHGTIYSEYESDYLVAGGIAGQASNSKITNCYNSEPIIGGHIGGICGNAVMTEIVCCGNTGDVLSSTYDDKLILAGGISGSGGAISDCFNRGNLMINNGSNANPTAVHMGGIIGTFSSDGYIHNCYNISIINHYQYSNGQYGIIAGVAPNSAYFNNCYWNGNYDIQACSTVSTLPGSCSFSGTASQGNWYLTDAQYNTHDLLLALNRGSIHGCYWTIDGNGYPKPIYTEPNYPVVGTEWYYEIINVNGSVTYQYLECAADTTIGNTRPKVIVRSNTLYDKDLHTKVTHEYVYSEDGIVYWWDKQSQNYTTLYNFNANVGDQWTIHVGTQNITMHVDEVNNVEYNGQTYRVLTVSEANDIFSGDIICGIGHTTSFFPEKMLNNRDFDVDGMRCYWHFGEELLQFGEVDCDEIYNIYNDVAENEETGFEVYPNPAKDILIIKSDVLEMCHGAYLQEYTITNITGQIMMRGTISSDNQQINIENLPDGMYFVNINNQIVKIIKN